jgi:hypothetical protein
VVHCTELPDIAAARAFAERVLYAETGTGNSGHWYIDRDGSTWQYVPHERIAHHVRGHNPRSIGIELVNIGRYPDWLDSRRQAMDEPYPAAQIGAAGPAAAAAAGSCRACNWSPATRTWTPGRSPPATTRSSACAASATRARCSPGQASSPACGLQRMLR